MGRCDIPASNDFISIIQSANLTICDENDRSLVAIFERYDDGDHFFLEVFESHRTWSGKIRLHNPYQVFDNDRRSNLPSSMVINLEAVNK